MYKNKKKAALLFLAILAVVFISGCAEKNSYSDNINSTSKIPENDSNTANPQVPAYPSNQTGKNETPSDSSAGAVDPKTDNSKLKENTSAETNDTPKSPEVSGIFIAKTSDVPEGSFRYFDYNGKKAILLNLNGEYKTYFNSCTHKNCATEFRENVLFCPCHGSKFNPLTGEVMKGPASSPLGKIELFIEDGSIYVR